MGGGAGGDGSRVDPIPKDVRPKLASKSFQDQFFSVFLRIFIFSKIFIDFCSSSYGFWEVLGRIWGGFFDDFWKFSRKSDFVKTSVFPRENQ